MIDCKLPTISLVTPSFNQGKFVEATVCSVLDQGYPNVEYLFMDGGSTDETLARVAPYRDRFAYFKSAADEGQSAAIAEGFSRSSGDIMAYLNSDDLLLPGTLNFVANFFKHNPQVDLIYSHRCVINAKNRVIGHWVLPRHSSFLMRRWDLIPQETCFWRRSLFETHGNIDKSFWFAMDYDLFVRYMKTGKFKRVDRFLGAFRIHEQAKTATHLASTGMQEIARIHEKNNFRFFIPYLGKLFPLWVQLRSALFVSRNECFPGLPPGIDYPIDEIWGKTGPCQSEDFMPK